MIWRVRADDKISRILVLPKSAEGRFNFKNWDGEVCTIDWIHRKSDFAVFGLDAPTTGTCVVYSKDPMDAVKHGVRMVEGLSEDTLCAALEICTRFCPEEIVVLDSDISDSVLVVNANPLDGGVDPRAYGIETPEGYPRGEIVKVVTGYHAVPNMSNAGRAWIIGGGPSLACLDLDALPKEDLVIGCNDACRLPQVGVCCFHDKRWGVVHEKWLEDESVSFYTSGPMHHPRVHRIQQTSKLFSKNQSLISFGSNTGAMAINFAYLAGAREIVLLGFDMKMDENGRTNWHDDNINAPKPYNYATYIDRSNEMARTIARDCPDLKIVNLNPDSAMDAFEKVHPFEYLPGLEKMDVEI